ncbi:hypothetical protein [Dongia deserti]|uniref:hypothetical protein n=1 Tax=Dongia deserti TaxID=2268030 RepID=UPI000E65E0D1|nr:hypothetical protein [Dongia deserti]
MKDEIERIKRVADTLCTGHAGLRDRYARRALLLDIAILALSAWLTALAFIDPHLNITLTPFGLDPQLWTGVVAFVTFLLSIVQLKTDWKARSDSHRRSLDVYAEVKREAGYLLASWSDDEAACRRVLARYDMASAVAVAIPESEFLRQKSRHKLKVEVSKYIDDHPGASIWLTRIKLWLRDNRWGS